MSKVKGIRLNLRVSEDEYNKLQYVKECLLMEGLDLKDSAVIRYALLQTYKDYKEMNDLLKSRN
ncbi:MULTISPECIES: hypothetical protein [Bacillus cereus group]|jgi:hypothetical protein|uniref:Uncharacterized protein n=2 Tax=Bacillus thuringiensis TaxID=1428 RepID=A0A9W4EY93_BACTO|nr:MULTISPECIES: hypothetical protein [Bacillus cereus group]AGE81748.1 hypothetical protein HD73_8024 [Bacillus thuringiensis serovar kurstaki str. HD73]AGG04364.1 hypothetical protein H175_11p07 [Bacillus thuringiensis serovar thuringiensis str. IS5056]AHZ55107.1 hypothetical protein YBT1520_34051 [Bacillus thuringiensis serovar kurstaki str. YBT-1520]AIM34339.1 hypothetical protein DF16_pBMB11orf00015 [Bacillus thuringiensis serovar kurstaki str. YBT-1520]ARP61876.1 hypothetical protein CAB